MIERKKPSRLLKKSLFSPAQPRRAVTRQGRVGVKSGLFEQPA
jgi:hypothetical protein